MIENDEDMLLINLFLLQEFYGVFLWVVVFDNQEFLLFMFVDDASAFSLRSDARLIKYI